MFIINDVTYWCIKSNVSIFCEVNCDMIDENKQIGGDEMDFIKSSEELMKHISDMDRNNSVLQFTIPGKGKFTLVFQEDEDSIETDIEKNPTLKQMIKESQREYKEGKGMTTSELLHSLSPRDFE